MAAVSQHRNDWATRRGRSTAATPRFGQYFTVWKRQADGSWKWIYDGGTDQREATRPNAQADVQVLEPVAGGNAGDAAVEIIRAEGALAGVASIDAARALAERMLPEGRVNRSHVLPGHGPEGARAAFAGGPAAVRLHRAGAHRNHAAISRSPWAKCAGPRVGTAIRPHLDPHRGGLENRLRPDHRPEHRGRTAPVRLTSRRPFAQKPRFPGGPAVRGHTGRRANRQGSRDLVVRSPGPVRRRRRARA